MKRESLETLVGAVVVAIAAAFVAFGASGGAVSSESGATITAEFGSVGALAPGADVRVGGVRVGGVSGMELNPESFRAVVSMTLDGGVEIPEDSSAKILSDGLLGDSYVALEVGGAVEPLSEGARVEFTQDAVNVIDLVSRLIASGVEYELQQQAQ